VTKDIDQKPPKEKPPSEISSSARPWTTLIGLGFGTIIMYAIVWIAAGISGEKISEFFTKDHAIAWSAAVVENFNSKQDAFGPQGLQINDKYTLADFQKGTNIYRWTLTQADGRVFASSKISEIGKLENRPKFISQLVKGKVVAVRKTVSADELDGYTLQSHISGLSGTGTRHIIEVAIPIIKNKQFVGAIFVFQDITSLLLWANKQAKLASFFFSGILTLVFMAIAVMIWSYGTVRLKQNTKLKDAIQEAENAEKEARDMAGTLQTMNDDISQLNNELNSNMTTLREAQNEVIRKGKMAQLGQLTATVAHDIRNPLGAVRTSAFLLRRKFAEKNPTMEKPLARIENGVERCDKIISQLLDFARTSDIDRKSNNLDEWLVDLVREQSEMLPDEISFQCHLGLKDQEYSFDANSLTRAIINFLANASEAMVGKGNDKPEVKTENPTIVIETLLSDRGIEISVSDNGPGIAEKNLNKILEPLYTTKSFGVGLGLPAVKKIFEQHGGDMEIQSKEGKGAKFTGWIAIDRNDDLNIDKNAA